jgi:hypothetical protein
MQQELKPLAGNGTSIPAIAGIAAGVSMIILFSIFFVPALTNPGTRTWVSYEPTQCSTSPWMSYWNELHPDDDFRSLGEEHQYQVIKEYFRERAGINVFDVTYRISLSPNCLACGCSAGYIIDFQVNENDEDKLRQDILKATVRIDDST